MVADSCLPERHLSKPFTWVLQAGHLLSAARARVLRVSKPHPLGRLHRARLPITVSMVWILLWCYIIILNPCRCTMEQKTIQKVAPSSYVTYCLPDASGPPGCAALFPRIIREF